mgnify:CR=1 FL=1
MYGWVGRDGMEWMTRLLLPKGGSWEVDGMDEFVYAVGWSVGWLALNGDCWRWMV